MSAKIKSSDHQGSGDSSAGADHNGVSINDLRAEINELKEQVTSLRVHSRVQNILLPIALSLIVALGYYKLVLDDHPISSEHSEILKNTDWNSVQALEGAQSALLEILILDLEERVIDSMRQVSFTSPQARLNSYIQDTTRRVSEVEGKLGKNDQFNQVKEIAFALELVSRAGDKAYNEAEELLIKSLPSMTSRKLEATSWALVGLARTLSSRAKYNKKAKAAFEGAIARESETFRLGLSHNGLGIQLLFQAREIAKDDPKRALVLLSEAKRSFREQDEIDKTSKSRFGLVNNTINVDLTLLQFLCDGLLSEESLIGELGQYESLFEFFSDTERALEELRTISWGNPVQLGTAAEFWSLRMEYEGSLGGEIDTSEAERFYGLSRSLMKKGISDGLFEKYGSLAKALEKLENDRHRKTMLDHRDSEARTEMEDEIKKYYALHM